VPKPQGKAFLNAVSISRTEWSLNHDAIYRYHSTKIVRIHTPILTENKGFGSNPNFRGAAGGHIVRLLLKISEKEGWDEQDDNGTAP
jgi:hypothetical protein